MIATWDDTVAQFTRVTDKLGKRIDGGIFETVVALNINGVHTVASCEGHLDWGVPYPWIDIEADLDQKFILHTFLSRFYQQRVIDFDAVLVFQGYRMRPAGGAFSSLLSSEVREQKLRAYQQEVLGFTAFMKSLL